MFRVAMLVSAIALPLLAACIRAPSTSAPGPTASAFPISREQAIQTALWYTGSMPEVTAVENPRNPAACLMTLREYQERIGERGSFLTDPDALVWVVQFEGESYSAGIAAEPRTQFNYVVVVMDAQSGRMIAQRRPFVPLPWESLKSGAPLPPLKLAATLAQGTSVQGKLVIRLAWLDYPDNETSYVVERSEVSESGPWEEAAVLPANTTGFDDSLPAGKEYFYRVKSRNSAGDSPYSNVATPSPGISKTRAIEIASWPIPAEVLARAHLTARLERDVWVVTFENVNATFQELRYPAGPNDPPWTATKRWQNVAVEVHASSGRVIGRYPYNPRGGPYIGQEEAIALAKKEFPAKATGADVHTYLRGEQWIVIFYDADFQVEVDAITGAIAEYGRNLSAVVPTPTPKFVLPSQGVWINPPWRKARSGEEIYIVVQAGPEYWGVTSGEINLQFDPAVFQAATYTPGASPVSPGELFASPSSSPGDLFGMPPLIELEEIDNQAGMLRYALARSGATPSPRVPGQTSFVFAFVNLIVSETAKSGTYELTLRVSLTDANHKDIADIKVQGASIEIDRRLTLTLPHG